MAEAAIYEIRVAGHLGPAAREAFAGFAHHTETGATVLVGNLDQDGLLALLDQVEALGLELVDLRRHGPRPGP